MSSPMRPIVVTRLGVRSKQGKAPAEAWLDARLTLLREITWPSLRQQGDGLAWVLLVDAARRDQAADGLRDVTLPGGRVHLGTTVGFVPTTAEIKLEDEVHAGVEVPRDAEGFLTFRLDSDDALLPGAVALGLQAATSAADGDLVDLPHGYQLDVDSGTAVETIYAPARQGPFLALVHRSRASMLDTGGQHTQARAGRSVRRVQEAAWVQVLHGDNVANALSPRPMRRRAARAARALARGTSAAREAWNDGRTLSAADARAVVERASITAPIAQ